VLASSSDCVPVTLDELGSLEGYRVDPPKQDVEHVLFEAGAHENDPIAVPLKRRPRGIISESLYLVLIGNLRFNEWLTLILGLALIINNEAYIYLRCFFIFSL